MVREKVYYLKEISEDGLLKDPRNRWGDRLFSLFGYDSEEEVWEALEREAKIEWWGHKYKPPIKHIVVCEWVVRQDERD